MTAGSQFVTDTAASAYDSLGAETGLRSAVDKLYDRIHADPLLAPYFAGVDMPTLRRHQVDMLSAATGGPQKYSGRDMAKAHAGLDITDEAFDRVVGHLNATLVETGADDGAIRAVLGALVPLRPSIVTA
jgi:hemoglobin